MPDSLPADILTPRLALIAITHEAIRAEQEGGHRLGEVIHCLVPAEWPPPHWEPHVFDLMLSQFERHPDQLGWPRYMALSNPDGSRTLIGFVGAYSKTDPPVECEIGYSLVPSFGGHGYATEAAQALIDFLRQDDRIVSIYADTLPGLTGSIKVLERCGLTFDGNGEEPGTIRYRLRLRPTQ